MEDTQEISLDSLKNPDNVEDNPVSFSIEDIEKEETHLEYKKRLNKKVSEFTPEEKTKYNSLAGKNKRKNDKSEEQKKEEEEKDKLNEEEKNNLYNQLFVLKQKFPDNTGDIVINKEMSLNILQQKKSLILQIITSKNSENVVFETLLLMARTGERGVEYFGVDALKGYADNLTDSKEDIIPILKEMVDTGEIDCSMMTPQLRLMIIMSSCAVRTIQENADKKNCEGVVASLDTESLA